jgi:cytoskeletal protein CcmA (bactofilin family)
MLSRFGKGGNGSSPRKAPSGQTLSLIGADVRIVGNISTEGEIQIDGQLEGDIACRHLLIGETGRIAGDIIHDSIEIEAGARLEGRLIRKSAPTGAEPTPALATVAEPARLAPPRKEKEKDKAADSDLSPAPGAA